MMSVAPDSIEVPKDLPFLKVISWQLADCRQLTRLERPHQYERIATDVNLPTTQ
ncbi:hypothetical protein OsccyDRAFT_3669 [Leptolyngbyaceae cyanobacterium JSC-12]|nr:hypothetical protein OsccyDRAFT_3669 [Leptolyngbyaceae cyanobacterium JSC-12]